MNEIQKLIFVDLVGEDLNNNVYIYHFLFSSTPDDVWGQDFEQIPCINCGKLYPLKECYELTKTLKTSIKFKLAQKSSCYSFQDCMDGINSIAYEDIMDYEEYPDERLVFHFGDDYNKIEQLLLLKDCDFENE